MEVEGTSNTNRASDLNMGTVIYDGECKFCIQEVGKIQRMQGADTLEFLPRQHESSEQRFPALSGVSLEEGMVFIDAQQKLHFGAEAFYFIAKAVRPLRMKIYEKLYPLPIFKQCFHLGYRVIAANRKRLGKTCHDGVCKLPQ
jgi:predicted DCC family thiol-disulfide oxidoreductase YuxK